MTPWTVIYHRADFDGLFSGAVCAKFLPDAELIGWDFGDPIPQVPDDHTLFIVDLSIPELMGHPNLVWIDHHKSAIDKYPSTIPGYRIDGVAACRLCWQWFKRGAFNANGTLPTKDRYKGRDVDEPFALTLAGEYDVWDLHDPDALAFQFGLTSDHRDTPDSLRIFIDVRPREVGPEEGLFADVCTGKCAEMGHPAVRWQQAFASQVVRERSYQRTFEGLNFCILGSPHARNSMWFPKDALPEGTDALMCWRYDGTQVAFSLYHAPGHEQHDLSLIATKYGGGGHRGACGFMLPLDKALEVIR